MPQACRQEGAAYVPGGVWGNKLERSVDFSSLRQGFGSAGDLEAPEPNFFLV